MEKLIELGDQSQKSYRKQCSFLYAKEGGGISFSFRMEELLFRTPHNLCGLSFPVRPRQESKEWDGEEGHGTVEATGGLSLA